MEIIETPLPGCLELRPNVVKDERGMFVKIFQRDQFRAAGMAVDFAECFQSVSRKGALRGLHFQRPPADHDKLVYCASGEIFDAVLDLRGDSPAYGRHAAFWLDALRCNVLYIPRGLAHGFQVVSDEAVIVYLVTSTHSPLHDDGIRWDSAGIPWPIPRPIVSSRDTAFGALSDFKSPFLMSPAPRSNEGGRG